MFHTFLKNILPEDIEWMANQPNVMLRKDVVTEHVGWNVKPSLLKHLLLETEGPVVWCDSDVILSSPVSPILEAIPTSVFVASEEHCWGRTKGSKIRTAGWEFTDMRPLKSTVNSSFMRMNSTHVPLLDAWIACLSRPSYMEAQLRQWDQRPEYFIGDQDALTALLASSEYAHVPLHLLRSGRDIAQCFEDDGYTANDRFLNAILRRTPPLIHAQGGKPWRNRPRAIFQQLSPYNPIAGPYLKNAMLPTDWIGADTKLAKLIDSMTFSDPNLRGFLPALIRTLLRVWRHRRHLFKPA